VLARPDPRTTRTGVTAMAMNRSEGLAELDDPHILRESGRLADAVVAFHRERL